MKVFLATWPKGSFFFSSSLLLNVSMLQPTNVSTESQEVEWVGGSITPAASLGKIQRILSVSKMGNFWNVFKQTWKNSVTLFFCVHKPISFGTIPNTTGSNVAPNNDRASTRHSRSLLTSSTHILITINRSGELKFGFKRPVSIIGVHFLCNLAYVSHKNSYLKATETISDEALLNTSWINWRAGWILHVLC